MHEYLRTLLFSLTPLILVGAVSLVLPPAGALLSMRNEILLGLALPSAASAGIALGLFLGFSSESVIPLYSIAVAVTITAVLLASSARGRGRGRELRLAGVFIGGQACAMLFSALSPRTHAHVAHLLNGEVLAAGTMNTAVIAAACILLPVMGAIMRHRLFAWCVDEDLLRIGMRRYNLFAGSVTVVLALMVTVAVASVGPLLVMALLVVPALMCDNGRCGVGGFMLRVMVCGVVGSIGGFLAAIALDLPPALCAALGIGIAGSTVQMGRLLRR